MSYRFADRNQLDALISQIYFWNKTLHVSDNSSAHHQDFFSLYTKQWYMSYRCADRNQLDALISQIYFWNKTLHVSDNSSVHHQEFFTDSLLSANLYDIYHCCVYSEKLLMMDRGTVRNM